MKNRIYLFVLSLTALFAASCYEDLGNYDYEDLNTVTISKFKDGGYVCARGEVLDIIPGIKLENDSLGDVKRYEYSWVAKNKNVSTDKLKTFSLSDERNLYYQMNLPAGDYVLIFTVKDKKTELSWIQSTQLSVTGSISEGWLLLTEKQQDDGMMLADMSVYARNTSDGTFKLLNDILEFSGFPYLNGPRKVVCKKPFGFPVADLYILTDGAVGWLNSQTYMWDTDQLMKYQTLEATPTDYTLKNFEYFSSPKHSFGFTEKGGLQMRGEFSMGAVWSTDIGYIVEGGKKTILELAPYIGGYQAAGGMNMVYLLFDTKSQNFVSCKFSNPTANEAVCASFADSWAKTGKDLIYMQSVGNSGGVNALMKDKDNKIYQYSFTVMSGMTVMLNPVSGIKEINAPNLLNANHITYNQSYEDYLYYSVGDKLYCYYDGKETLAKTMNGNITCLKSQFFMGAAGVYLDYMKYLIVAAYQDQPAEGEEAEATVTFFLPEQGKADVLKVADEIRHLDKVVSIDYQK